MLPALLTSDLQTALLAAQWLHSRVTVDFTSHSGRCGGAVLLDLPEGWQGSSGHVIRSDTVGVSGRYFSEEKICVVFQVIRWAAGVPAEAQHKQTVQTPSSSSRRRCSDLPPTWLAQVEKGASTCNLRARARHTQLVITGAITRLQPVTCWGGNYVTMSGLSSGGSIYSNNVNIFHIWCTCTLLWVFLFYTTLD